MWTEKQTQNISRTYRELSNMLDTKERNTRKEEDVAPESKELVSTFSDINRKQRETHVG